MITTPILPGSSYFMGFKMLQLYSECDGDTTLEAFDDNVAEDPEDETLDALDEYFESQVEDVTLDAPESAENQSSAANDAEEPEITSPSMQYNYDTCACYNILCVFYYLL